MNHDKEVTVRMEIVTPVMARGWLKHNKNNRMIRKARVAQYADLMRRGLWTLNHHAIAFGADGELYDGQHRLMAIVEAGVSVPMMVVRGLQPQSRVDMDRGEARGAADNAAIAFKRKLTTQEAAACRILHVIIGNGTNRQSMSTVDLIETRDRYDMGFMAVRSLTNHAIQKLSRGAVVAAFVFAAAADVKKVEEAARAFASGANLSAGDPMLALRNAFLQGRGGSAIEDFKRTLSAIDAVLARRRLSKSLVRSASVNDAVIERFNNAWSKVK